MAVELFTNEASTTVSSGGTTAPAPGTAETWTVASSASFPAISGIQQFHVADPASAASAAEIVAVTAVSGTSWTVTRGAESTTPVAHAAGFTVQQVVSAGFLNSAAVTQPQQFLPESYGARRDGKIITDATMTLSSAVLTSASNPFTSADVGKAIIVSRAGGSSGWLPLMATISSYQSAGQVTLSTTAVLAVTAVGAIYGTDDTTAVQNCVNAAVSYARAHFGSAQVLLSAGLYCIAGAAVTGGSSVTDGALNLGNGQIALPYVDPTVAGNQKVSLSLKGLGGPPSPPPHWNQVTLETAGAVLVCMRNDGAYNATYGPSSVIGSPVDTGGLFSNLRLHADDLSILLPHESTYCGLNLHGLGQMDLGRVSVTTMATPASGSPWVQYETYGPVNVAQAGNMFALRSPTLGNNDQSAVYDITAYGLASGIQFTDHLSVSNARVIYCTNAIQAVAGPANDAHLCYFANLSIELCQNWIAANNAGGYACAAPTPLIVNGHFEHYNGGGGGNAIYDPGNKLWGQVTYEALSTAGYIGNQVNGAANIKLVAIRNAPGAVTSPQAAPLSTVAWPNYYYQDAAITLSVSGGSLSALTISGPGGAVTQTVPASATFYQFTLPSGISYTPTYTGTLTHTVTLL